MSYDVVTKVNLAGLGGLTPGVGGWPQPAVPYQSGGPQLNIRPGSRANPQPLPVRPGQLWHPDSSGSFSPPVFNTGMMFSDVGSSGLRQWSGWVREEFLPQLQGRQAARTYREMMDNSSVVGGLMYAINSSMRKITWRVDPADDSPEAASLAEFFDGCRDDMSHTWPEFIIEMQSMLGYGFCLPGNQNVTSADGRPIRADAVKVGDKLLTKEGRGRPVLRIFKRRHEGELTRLRVRGYPFPIRMTPNHKIITTDGWKNAGDLVPGEMLLRPRPILASGGDYASGWLVGLYAAEGTRDKTGRRSRIVFCLHIDEVDEVSDVLSKWIECKNLKRCHHLSKMTPQIMMSPSGAKDGRVLFSHPVFRALIDEWVGGNDSKTKHFKKLPTDEEFAHGLIDGWMYGDGHRSERQGGFPIAVGSTASESLAVQIQFIAGAIGLPSPLSYHIGTLQPGISGKARSASFSLSMLPQREVRHKRTAELEFEVKRLRTGGMTMQAIAAESGLSYLTVWRWLNSDGPKTQGLQCRVYQRDIGHEVIEVATELYRGDVFDFEIEEDHTYCAGPVAIHNSPMEIVYKKCVGRRPPIDPRTGRPFPQSQFDDGMIRWRKIALRGQDTIIKWFFGQDGEITGMTQQPWQGPIINIPIEKILLFRPSTHKNNPEGRSILRSAYRSYYLAKRIEEMEAILFERMGGIPTLYIPNIIMEKAANGDANAAAKLAAFKQIATNIRVDEQMGLVLPSDLWEGAAGGASGGQQFKFELVTPGRAGRGGLDSDKIISRYNVNILASVMADFLQLGHESRGTQALAQNKTDMFFNALEGFLMSGSETMNRYGIPRLGDINGMDPDKLPKYVPDMPQRLDLDVLGNFVLRLSQSGFPLFPNPVLEEYLGDAAGWPDISEDNSEAHAIVGPGAAIDIATNAPKPPPTPGEPANDDQPGSPRDNLKKIILASMARRGQRIAGGEVVSRKRIGRGRMAAAF